MPATIRCISASPRRAACAPARSSRRSAWARCCGPASATRSASRCRPSRRRKSGSASSILKSLDLRHRGVNIVSCPSCARQQFDVIRTVEALEKRVAHITTPMTLSVIGCVVNGPGEARETDIGFTGGGNGTHLVYLAGVPDIA